MLANKEYKESGVVWLGKLPAHWDVTNYRRLFCRRKEYDDNPDKQVLSLTIEGVKRKNENFGKMAEDFTGHQIVRKDDLVFTPRDFDATPILSGIAPCDGCISNLYFVLYPRTPDIDVNFYNYFMWGVKWGGDIWKKLSYGMRFSYNYDQFCALPAIKIPLKEQKAIANYLDKECAQIDNIVKKQRNIIEKLKEYKKSVITEAVTKGLNPNAEMKDSGIEWVGDVPADWEVRKMKTLGVFSSSGIDKTLNPNEPTVRIINYTDVYGNGTYILTEKKYMVVSAPAQKIKENLVKKGDLIFTPSSETIEDIGLSALVDVDLENTAFSYHVLRFVFNEKFDHRYKKYLCNNHFVLNWFSSHAKGTIRQTLSRDIFKSCLVFVPPLSEQSAIADHLDQKCTEIDSVIEKRGKMIDLLTEYKKSLIYECVTGKKEVA